MLTHEITVCIPSIPPRWDYLQDAIRSVLSQSYAASGISISVDHAKLGAAANRNKAMWNSKTEWVAFLDDDDYLLPHHLEFLVNKQIETGADVVFPWFETEPAGCDPFPQFREREYDPEEPHIFPITTLVRRSLAFEVGGFPHNLTSPECAGEDWQFWLLLRDAGAKFAHTPERTWVWRHHGENTSGLPSRWQ